MNDPNRKISDQIEALAAAVCRLVWILYKSKLISHDDWLDITNSIKTSTKVK